MGSCNTAQNERGGKDLLLKICKELEVDIAIGTADDPTAILATAHGLAVGDLVRFLAAEIGTITDVTVGTFYFVKAVAANSFTIAATPTGTAITFTDPATNMDIEVFETIGGLRSKGFSFAAEGIDISNHGTNQWKEILDEAGMRSVSISGSGVYNNTTNFRTMRTNAFAQLLTCLAFIDVKAGEIYSGCFKITGIEASGEYDGESSFSMSAESSGEVTVVVAA